MEVKKARRMRLRFKTYEEVSLLSNYIAERSKDFKVGKEYGELEKLWKEMTYLVPRLKVNRVLKQNYEADTDLKKMQEVLAQMQSNKASRKVSYFVPSVYLF